MDLTSCYKVVQGGKSCGMVRNMPISEELDERHIGVIASNEADGKEESVGGTTDIKWNYVAREKQIKI